MVGYDESMTAAKIAITLPRPLLAKVKGAVKRGRASSVSAFVSEALEARVREDSLAGLVRDLIAEHGASVVLVAREHHDAIVTSDVEDLRCLDPAARLERI